MYQGSAGPHAGMRCGYIRRVSEPSSPSPYFWDRPLRDRLRLIMRRRRVRQADLAAALGVSQPAVSRWLRRGEDRDLARVVAMVEAMGGRVEMHAVFDTVVRGRARIEVYALAKSRWPANFLERLEVAQRRSMPTLRWYDPHEEDVERTDRARQDEAQAEEG